MKGLRKEEAVSDGCPLHMLQAAAGMDQLFSSGVPGNCCSGHTIPLHYVYITLVSLFSSKKSNNTQWHYTRLGKGVARTGLGDALDMHKLGLSKLCGCRAFGIRL